MSPTDISHNEGGPICRAARLVTLASLPGTPSAAYVHAITIPTNPYDYDPKWYLVFLLWLSPLGWVGPFYVAMLPCLISWRSHLLGGIITIAISVVYIWGMCLGPIRSWGGAKTFMAYLLPLWGLFCAGGILHLLAWWKENCSNQ